MHAQMENPRLSWKRLLPVMLLLAGLAIFFALNLDRYAGFSALAEHRQQLLVWVAENALVAPLTYIGLYILVVAFSLPGATVMTLAGGFLFGAVAGGSYAVAGATLGATLLFLVARSSLGDYLLGKAGPSVKKMQAGFARDAWNYMLVLRLVPLFPFFLVNLAPAFLGVPLRTYLPATLVGILPATFIYALAGSGLGRAFERGESFSVGAVMNPQMLAALTGLGLLALLPVAYKRFRRTRP